MINCPECQNQELEGTLFCSRYGVALKIEDDKAGASTVPFAIESENGVSPPLMGKTTVPVEIPTAIRFIIPQSGRQIVLPLRDVIHIGRGDRTRDIKPELDLAEDDEINACISRRHAVIQATSQGVAIMDVGSTNGTFVNNFRIQPKLPYALSAGDELKLGNLVVHIFFEGE